MTKDEIAERLLNDMTKAHKRAMLAFEQAGLPPVMSVRFMLFVAEANVTALKHTLRAMNAELGQTTEGNA